MTNTVKPRVVVMNMTARSGKDTAVHHLLKIYNEAKHLTYKEKLIEATINFFRVSRERWDTRYDLSANMPGGVTTWIKDVPWEGVLEVGDKTYSQRTALIHVSENVMKPVFGKQVFGDAVANHLEEGGLYLVSDSGFDEELIPVLAKADVLVLKRDRLNSNWVGDSRGWVTKELGGKHVWVPGGIQDEADYLTFVTDAVGDWLGSLDKQREIDEVISDLAKVWATPIYHEEDEE